MGETRIAHTIRGPAHVAHTLRSALEPDLGAKRSHHVPAPLPGIHRVISAYKCTVPGVVSLDKAPGTPWCRRGARRCYSHTSINTTSSHVPPTSRTHGGTPPFFLFQTTIPVRPLVRTATGQVEIPIHLHLGAGTRNDNQHGRRFGLAIHHGIARLRSRDMVDIFYRVFGPKLGDCFDEPTMLGVTWTKVEKRSGGMREDGIMDDGPRSKLTAKRVLLCPTDGQILQLSVDRRIWYRQHQSARVSGSLRLRGLPSSWPVEAEMLLGYLAITVISFKTCQFSRHFFFNISFYLCTSEI